VDDRGPGVEDALSGHQDSRVTEARFTPLGSAEIQVDDIT
jgi:hypothetical protein